MIGIGGMTHAEKKAEKRKGKDRDHLCCRTVEILLAHAAPRTYANKQESEAPTLSGSLAMG
jgi:hypothetical protein